MNDDENTNGDILTITDLDNVNIVNPLKGKAMELMIQATLPSRGFDISLRKLIAEHLGGPSQYFTVETPFKVGDFVYSVKHEFLKNTDLPNTCCAEVNEIVLSRKWKVCNNCGAYILAIKQMTKKCRKCGEGYFGFKTKRFANWKRLCSGERDSVIRQLEEKRYLRRVQLGKRIDLFTYENGILYIFESKNKEHTGLRFSDIRKTLLYPLILKDCGYAVKTLAVVYNGGIGETSTGQFGARTTDDAARRRSLAMMDGQDLEEVEPSVVFDQLKRSYQAKHNIEVRLIPVFDYLRKKDPTLAGVTVQKVAEKWHYAVVRKLNPKDINIWIVRPVVSLEQSTPNADGNSGMASQ